MLGGLDLGPSSICSSRKAIVLFGNATLFGGVSVAECNGAVLFDGVEVDGDAERGADFVLAAVAASDGTGRIVKDVPALLQLLVEAVARSTSSGLFLRSGKTAALYGAIFGLNFSRVRFSALPLSLGTSSSV